MLNGAKRLVHSAYLAYRKHSPIRRGKHRMGVVVDRIVGPARYEINGVRLLLTPVALIDRKLISGEDHDPLVASVMLESLRDGGALIDVGANIGYISLLAATRVGQGAEVFAFEPSPREFAKLTANIRLNAGVRVTAFPHGVGGKAETGRLYLADVDNPGMNSRLQVVPGASVTEAQFAPIDTFLSPEQIRRTRCVKIDVEGDELSVLDGLASAMPLLGRATFIVEISRDFLARAGRRPEDIYAFFSAHSFRPRSGDAPRDEAQYDEVFVPATQPAPVGA